MARYSKKNNSSEQTKEDALSIARGTQKPGQSKEQTKLIAQGIQKGIDQYKKRNKEKARDLDKKLNKLKSVDIANELSSKETNQTEINKSNKLPWVLLLVSWLCFSAYVLLVK